MGAVAVVAKDRAPLAAAGGKVAPSARMLRTRNLNRSKRRKRRSKARRKVPFGDLFFVSFVCFCKIVRRFRFIWLIAQTLLQEATVQIQP
jgi:hypothetical protein